MSARLHQHMFRSLLALAAGAMGTLPGSAQAGPWAAQLIDQDPFSVHGQPQAADLDGDGDLDVLTSYWWYEHTASASAPWSEHLLGLRYGSSTRAADLDGDGDLDVATTLSTGLPSSLLHEVGWLENVDGGARTLSQHAVGPAGTSEPLVVDAVDLDGDGDLDLIVFTTAEGLTWLENGTGPRWIEHALVAGPRDVTVAAADVDGDGDKDLFLGRSASGIVWLENPGAHPTPPISGGATLWVEHLIHDAFAGTPACIVRAQDIDGDGDCDAAFVLQGLSFRGLQLPDVTGWLDNLHGDGSAWAPRLLTWETTSRSTELIPRDLDRDGDVDFVRPSSRGLLWYENQGDARTFEERSIGIAGRTQDIADLDADGDLDVLSDRPFSSLGWHENQTTTTPYGSGINPPGSLRLESGPLSIGVPATLSLANPLGTQAAGSLTRLRVALRPSLDFPAGVQLPGFGMHGAGAPGELLIAGSPGVTLAGPAWLGPGTRAPITMPIPAAPSLVGTDLYMQGLLIDDANSSAVRFGLTNGLRARIGP